MTRLHAVRHDAKGLPGRADKLAWLLIGVRPTIIAKAPKATTHFFSPTSSGGTLGVLARSYPRGKRIGEHMHREAQLLFAAQGVMQVTTPTGRWLVPPTRAVWLPPRLEHAVDALSDIEMRALLIDPAQFDGHADALRLSRAFVVIVRPLLREVILASFDAALDTPRRALLQDLALYELAEAEDAATFIPMPTEPRARRVAELVLADPAGRQSLDDLARTAGTSLRTVSRLFPAETDLTFKEWRQRARILAGVEALGGGRLTVKQVAVQLGFSSVAAFGHAFRQVMGITPSALVKGSLD
ncbi:AraC-like DNA-binding protein/quercetin dioxygenase-like cupin family protein [Methylobacterium sp. OAE515]|uniref:AraC family transcriptional regulator n=1 Tax=Methylobacterium sp. OAE515 TaxID=2817895 RepID=UPI00178C0F81